VTKNNWSGGGVLLARMFAALIISEFLASQCDLQSTKQIWHFRGSIKLG